MGIRFSCPNGHKLNVKVHLAGKRAICPQCGSKVVVPDAPAAEEPQSRADRPITRAASQGAASAVDSGSADSLPPTMPSAPRHKPSETSFTAADALPDSILATAFNAPGADSAATESPESAVQSRRGRRNQLIVSLILLFIVVLLAVALYWVLTHHVSTTSPVSPDTATPSAAPASPETPSSPATEAAAPTAATPDAAATDTSAPSEPAPPQKE